MQKRLLQNFFNPVKHGAFEVTYWDGTTEQYGQGDPTFKLVFHKKVPYGWIIKDQGLAFGEAYMEGAIELSGELNEIIKFANSNMDVFGQQRNGHIWAKFLSHLPQLPTSLRKQQEDVQYHYDLGNDFFSLWLDETMSYSCAYFQSPRIS